MFWVFETLRFVKKEVSLFSSADNGGSVARGKVSFLSIILCPVYMKSNVYFS